MRALRMIPLLAGLLPGPAAPAAAQAAPGPPDTLPLHPGRIPVRFHVQGPAWVSGATLDGYRLVLNETRFSTRAGGREMSTRQVATLLEVDGVPVAGWSAGRVEMALTGPVGSTVELTVPSTSPARRTLRMRREPPAALHLPGTVVTPHFVVHHAPGEERAARRIAARAERRFARVPHPADTGGRRGHLYMLPDSLSRQQPPFWAWWTRPFAHAPGGAGMHGYVAFGVPGAAAAELGSEARTGLPAAGDGVHREAVRWLVPALNGGGPVLEGRLLAWSPAVPSLGAYVRDRYGLDRFGELWRAQEPFGTAVPRVLGTTHEQLVADWKRHVFSLGPDVTAGPGAGETAMAVGLAGVLLLGCAAVARTREV